MFVKQGEMTLNDSKEVVKLGNGRHRHRLEHTHIEVLKCRSNHLVLFAYVAHVAHYFTCFSITPIAFLLIALIVTSCSDPTVLVSVQSE